jgi:hypothetical protein
LYTLSPDAKQYFLHSLPRLFAAGARPFALPI